MAYVSNQWLNQGYGLRNRSYSPVPVTVTCQRVTGAWWSQHGAGALFTARRSSGAYQRLHLSEVDADSVAATVVSCMSDRAREKLLQDLLGKLSDPKLLRALAFDLRKRKRLPKER